MTERGTKTLIGAFVLGAVALLVAGILLVGSGTLFSKSVEFVLYFDSSLRGLVAGSPVYFKGVRVGKVVSIQISVGSDDQEFRTPVVIELENALITGATRGDPDADYTFMNNEQIVDGLIRRGLRAKLGIQSFITGQLTVDLDIVPDAPPVDPASLRRFRGIQQIPTMPSSLDAVLAEASQIPVQEIAHEALLALEGINRQLEGLDLPAMGRSLMALSEEIRTEVEDLAAVRRETMVALHDFSALARNADRELTGALRRANTVLNDVSSLTRASRSAVDSAALLLREDSAPMLEFGQTLQALRDAAAAVTNLATLLELKPDALIFGRDRR